MQTKISLYYLFVFFGFGALYPMMGLYFDDIGLTGSQIGMIMSIGPIVAIMAQPIWGMLSDRTQKPKLILTLTTVIAGTTGLLFFASNWYIYLLLAAAFLSIFQSAVVPISDSLAMSYVKKSGIEYGSLRLWGAIGFAVAVWFAGLVIEVTFTGVIFIIFAVALWLSAIFAHQMPSDAEPIRVDLRAGLARLVKIPAFVIFLMSTFMIFGAINANNFYFGIYYVSIGGTVAGVGLVFLIAAGSEAPFMRIVGSFIRRFGLINILIFAAILSAARWLFFYFEPSTGWVLAVSIVQGISVGFYIPAAIQLVRDLTPDEIKVTGMSIYASFGNGLGTMACTFAGGFIFEYYSILHTYLFFGFVTCIGILCLVALAIMDKRQKIHQSR